MKALRLTEVLWPLLAARGWAPWKVEPRAQQRKGAHRLTAVTVASAINGRDRLNQRRLYDDVR
jgi:hypothetical protein